MSTDDHIRNALRSVADDSSDTSDDEEWAAISASASATPSRNGPWKRPMVLVAASVAIIAAVAGAAIANAIGEDDDRGSELNVIDDPTTTANDPVATVDGSTSTSSIPDSDEDDPETVFVGPGIRPMVVVSDNGLRVQVFFSDGRDPIDYQPDVRVIHAEISPAGHLLLTVNGRDDFGPGTWTSLLTVDPTTGEEVDSIDQAGYAATSPDGATLAYVNYLDGSDFAASSIRIVPVGASGEEAREVLAIGPELEPGTEVFHPFGQIHWSPDGTRILVNEFWEDDIVWLVDLETDTYVRDGMSLGLRDPDWISDDRLLATQYCCYSAPEEEARHLVEVDLSGAEPVVVDRSEASVGIIGVRPGRLGDAVHVAGDTFDNSGPLVRISSGQTIAEDVVSVQW